LGAAISAALAHAGAQVIITSRTLDKAQKQASELSHHGASVRGIACDITSTASISAVPTALDGLGVEKIDIFVYLPGGNSPKATVTPDQTVSDISSAAGREIFENNFWGFWDLTMAILPRLIKAREASVISIGSMSAHSPLTRVAFYGAAKAALVNLTKWMAGEFALKREQYGSSNIRCNCLVPGFVVSEQNRALLLTPQGEPTTRGKQIIQHTPMGRFAEAREIAGAAVYLASDASRFVTGQEIVVDGGFSAMTI
jgi:NAD(P)-dependent dehydrogenase (short-subunit alcohol dehydrogenase family)